MIRGLGLDVVEVARFTLALERAPRLAVKLFTPEERGLPAQSLAARFAAKEALAKALGAPGDLAWHDVWVVNNQAGQPSFATAGSVRRRCATLGVNALHLTITHDAGLAAAVVVAEG